ncbi:MAG TPA: DUF1501 domain-containing protein [Pirellulales bacterium]|nr:DUF1501 domain-containing protein [Pirellulales bacterium]
MTPARHQHRLGLDRRELLQVGFSGLLGLHFSQVLARTAVAENRGSHFGRAKSVILVFCTGAPAHQDIWDLKPEAPVEVRGEFKPADTCVPGVQITPHLPLLAKMADRYAIVRSMTHSLPGHEQATHFVLTGVNELPAGATHMASRNDWPCYASCVQYLRPRSDGLPSGVMLPTYLHNGYGFSGQNGGFMGSTFDPWQLTRDPNAADFRLTELDLLPGLTVDRLGNRRALLANLDDHRRDLAEAATARDLSARAQNAYTLLTENAQFRAAFDLQSEPAAARDRYGRHAFGQSLLLARRLVEAGMPVIQANMGSMNNWDTHGQNFQQLKDRLLPPLDQGLSALFDDLQTRGLFDQTLVVVVGEFGRTPQINAGAGRDHWSGVFSAVFAGAGVRGGQVIGASDAQAAWPATRGWYPADLGATVYSALGIDPGSQIVDRFGRPHRLNAGEIIAPLYG